MYTRFYRRVFILVSIAVLGYALLQILAPFFSALAWAAFLAFLLHPVHRRLTRRLNGRAGFSAGIITALTPVFVLAPLVVLALRWIRANVALSAEQLQSWLTGGLQSLLKSAAAMGGNALLGVVGTLVGFFLMMFLLFFLLRDGRSMLDRVARLIPLAGERRKELTNYLAEVTRAVVYGSALTGIIQGTLVGIGFAIAGLPSPVVFAVLAAVAAFIPAAGTGLVMVPAVLYLMIAGRWGTAVFLGVWAGLVGVSDNILRPVLTAQRADVSTLAVFVGVIGGASAFGFIGLFIGPVLLSLIVALLRFAEETLTERG
jgi:predicted PurR-regulated permease PerM